MATLTLVIGATAAGKTFFIQQSFNQKDVKILNVYDYQQKVYDEEGIVDLIPFGMHMRANTLLLKDIVEELQKDVMLLWNKHYIRPSGVSHILTKSEKYLM